MVASLIVGCNGNYVSSALKDPETRRNLYSEILRDHDYLTELLDSIKSSRHARMMLQTDTALIGQLMENGPTNEILNHIMRRSENDSTTCKEVCQSLMGHKAVMAAMLQSLEQKGVVKKGCMMDMNAKTAKKPEKQSHH